MSQSIFIGYNIPTMNNVNFYLFFGEDGYRAKAAMATLLEKDFSQHQFQKITESISLGELKNEFSSAGSLFGEAKALVFLDFSNQADDIKEAVIDHLESKDLAVPVIIRTGKLAKNSRLLKAFTKHGETQEFNYLSPVELMSWVESEVKSRSGKINRGAVAMLLSLAGRDTWVLSNEIDKLVSFANGAEIASDDVTSLVSGELTDRGFALMDALGTRKTADIQKFLQNQLEMGEDPQKLFGLFVYQFRNLLMVRDLLDRGITQKNEIESVTGLHPYVAMKITGQARRFRLSELKKFYEILQRADLRIKQGELGATEAIDFVSYII